MNINQLARAALLLTSIALATGCARSGTDAARSGPASNPAHGTGAALAVRDAESPSGPDSREPELTATADGRIILSWVERVGEKRHALRFAARDAAGGWSEVRTVAEGDNWFVNWADFPSVIATADGGLAAHWLVKSGPGTYAYDVNVARSKDAGKTWGRAVVPHTDRTQTEHGFVSLLPLSDGRVGAVWVDGRNLKDVKEGEEKGPLPASMSLRYAAIDADGRLSDEAVLDERICECCQTSAALTSEGAIAVYRNRSEDEVRDIYFVRQQGGRWSEPRAVHADGWQIKGCPVNGPSVAADGRRVAVAWFTGAGNVPRVKVAFSVDAGANFGNPVEVDDGDALGRVDVVMLPDGSALVCWMSGGADGGANKVRRISPDGALGAVAVIARSDVSRSSGFPRMARLGDEAHFAWTQFGKPSLVRTAAADVGAYK